MMFLLLLAAPLLASAGHPPVSGALPTQTQEAFSASELDIAEGGAIYRNACLGCHGPDGDWRDVDVAARSMILPENDLRRIIIGGVPGTAMQPNSLTAFEAGTVADYLRSIATDRITAEDGDAARGRDRVEGDLGCLECHMIRGNGSIIAPDLSGIGGRRRSSELRDSLLDPNAEVRTENRYVDAVRTDGRVVRGRLLNQDSLSIQLLGIDERLVSMLRRDLDRVEFIESPMPAYAGRLDTAQINDVVRYLASLR